MGKIAKNVPDSVKQKNPKNKKSKRVLTFDDRAREDYLTGFSKRKQERRRVAQEKIIEDLKEQKRQLKLKKRQELNEKWEKLNLKLDFDHIVEPKVYDLDAHTVTITDVSGVDIGASTGLTIGTNQMTNDDSESDEDDKTTKKNNNDDSENSATDNLDKEDEEDSTKDKAKKKKSKGKFHKNLTHLMSKQNQAKARKKKKQASKIPAHMRERGSGGRKKRKPRNPRG